MFVKNKNNPVNSYGDITIFKNFNQKVTDDQADVKVNCYISTTIVGQKQKNSILIPLVFKCRYDWFLDAINDRASSEFLRSFQKTLEDGC